MTGQTGFRILFSRSSLERDNLFRVALFRVRFARTMTGFAADNFAFPAREIFETGVRGVREILKLIFVTDLAGLTADIVIILVFDSCRRILLLIYGGDCRNLRP